MYDHLYNGEIYDARLEQQQPFHQEASATTAVRAMAPDVGALVPQLIEPIRVANVIAAQDIAKFDTGCPKASNTLGGIVQEGDTLSLACTSGHISKIEFASFGTPLGACPAYKVDSSCNAAASADVVSKLCLGKSACDIPASNALFGGDPCPDVLKYLAVAASGCEPAPSPQRNVSWVFDFGVNMAGTSRLNVSGLPAGTRVSMLHGETRTKEGHAQNIFYNADADCSMAAWYAGTWAECANQTTAYIAAGKEPSVYTPRFTYQGFRFVELFGLPPDYPVTPATLVALQMRTDLEVAGSLQLPAVAAAPSGNTSDILNKAQQATFNAQAAQLWSLPTDCPTREKRGYVWAWAGRWCCARARHRPAVGADWASTLRGSLLHALTLLRRLPLAGWATHT